VVPGWPDWVPGVVPDPDGWPLPEVEGPVPLWPDGCPDDSDGGNVQPGARGAAVVWPPEVPEPPGLPALPALPVLPGLP